MSIITSTQSIVDTARAAFKAKVSVIPVREDGTKRPDILTWTPYRSTRPDADQLRRWFVERERAGIAVICGAVSGNLEVLDFDDRETYLAFRDMAVTAGLGEMVSRIETGYSECTPSEGIHWVYRCDLVEGSQKLARRSVDDEIKVLIETRGEGGYTVIAPSHGGVHDTGRPYQLLSGGLEHIAVISADERHALMELARAFDELPKAEYYPTGLATIGDGTRPGDQFNERGPGWPEILEPHGWQLVSRHGAFDLWRRPGKEHGVSATINGRGVEPDRLYVFSSSTQFEPNRSYSRFQAYVVLEYDGDFQAAAQALASNGYGESLSYLKAPASDPQGQPGPGVSFEDFRGFAVEGKYIYIPTGDLWPTKAVDNRLPPVEVSSDKDGKPIRVPASRWIDQHRSVEQLTWAPGYPTLIEDRLLVEGGWVERPGVMTYNLYRPPVISLGDPTLVDPWLEHLLMVYPDDSDHIIDWLAHCVQRPDEKINHALVLGGAQGIGKDTLLEPVTQAVGPWNVSEISPHHLLGRFNGFVRSVILRISEARDLGDVDRYSFYERCKVYTASPPEVLRVDEKHRQEYSIRNTCGVIITTNHLTSGLYLPADDRRHYIAWSACTASDFAEGYFAALYDWYESGGVAHVAAFLNERDLGAFDPKASPPKTSAFRDIVDAGRAPEDAELADVLEKRNWPDAITLSEIINHADPDLANWLRDRRNRRQIPHRMEECGYVRVRNSAAEDGLWRIGGKRQAVYSPKSLTPGKRSQAVSTLVDQMRQRGH